jgi:1,4-dihydroxy-2-naphthoate octaprenyltransferase
MTQQQDIPHSKLQRWLGAFVGFYRPAADELRTLDPVSKFLYAARSLILVISAQAAVIAGLLAATDRQFDWLYFVLVLVGFVVAHMISNLSNDYFGYIRGHDTPDSPRMRYTVHPLASGVLEPRILITGIAVLALIGISITVFFVLEREWLAALFALAGTVLLFAYDAAPIPLKQIGLGEVAVFLVWGPLMIGGGYTVITGHVSGDVFLVSIPYGLGVMSILIGKHIDQQEFDRGRKIYTLPVLLGEPSARRFNIVVIVLMYVVTAVLIGRGQLTPFAGLIIIALPRAVRAILKFRQPRPSSAPAGYIGWPLWYHRACLTHNRLFGWLYIFGLAVGAVWPGVLSK